MFQFKLKNVLSLREKYEESKKRELGAANAYKEKLEAERQSLLDEKTNVINLVKDNTSNKVDIKTVRQINGYIMYINHQIADIDNKIVIAKQKIEEKRLELIEAMKNKKILENLKKLQFEEYQIEEKRVEQKQVDEIISYKYSNEEVVEN